MAIDELREQYPDWQIDRPGNVTSGWIYVARPKAEAEQAPVFDAGQLERGLATRVSHPDARELARKIDEQDQLRREMAAAGEHPLAGRTYVDAGPTVTESTSEAGDG